MSVFCLWIVERPYSLPTDFYLPKTLLLDSQFDDETYPNDRNESEQLELSQSLVISNNMAKPDAHANFKVLSKAMPNNLVELCRWTGQRLVQLDAEIRKSGAGSNSQYCEEYAQRRVELANKQCDVSTVKDFQEFC